MFTNAEIFGIKELLWIIHNMNIRQETGKRKESQKWGNFGVIPVMRHLWVKEKSALYVAKKME